MSYKNDILNKINSEYRDDDLTKTLAEVLSGWMTSFKSKTDEVLANLFFNTLTLSGCVYFENQLAIKIIDNQTLDDRRAVIQAKWLSRNHNCLALIQEVCDAWKNGEVSADFIRGKITLSFLHIYGIPYYVEHLKTRINEVKPAHIAYELIYKYLLIKDIHEVKTIEEMENLTIGQFTSGME